MGVRGGDRDFEGRVGLGMGVWEWWGGDLGCGGYKSGGVYGVVGSSGDVVGVQEVVGWWSRGWWGSWGGKGPGVMGVQGDGGGQGGGGGLGGGKGPGVMGVQG